MKKFIAAIILFAISQYVFAQTGRDSYLVGGTVTASYNSSEGSTKNKTTSFSVAPEAGWFIIDNLSIGLSPSLSISTTKTSYNNSEEYKTNGSSFGVGPFVRYYVPVNKLLLISALSYGWEKGKSEFTFFDPFSGQISVLETKTETKTFYAGLGVGIVLHKNLTLEFLLNYRNSKIDTDSPLGSAFEQPDHQDLYLSIGFQVYLPKKIAE